jgi:hypothetical protein
MNTLGTQEFQRENRHVHKDELDNHGEFALISPPANDTTTFGSLTLRGTAASWLTFICQANGR